MFCATANVGEILSEYLSENCQEFSQGTSSLHCPYKEVDGDWLPNFDDLRCKYDVLFIFQNIINNFKDFLGHKQEFLDTKQRGFFISYTFLHSIQLVF